MYAKPSPQSTKVMLSVGMMQIPVNLYTRAAEFGVKRSMFAGDTGNRARQQYIDEVTREPITEIVKKVITEHGPVEVTDEETEALLEVKPNELVILSFQPQHHFHSGAYVPVTPYQMLTTPLEGPGKRKVPNAKADKILAMLLAGMRAKGALALVDLTTRGKPKPAVLLSDGTLWIVRFEEEIREAKPSPEVDLSEPEVAVGVGLVESLWRDDPVSVSDTRTQTVLDFATQKAEAGEEYTPTVVEAAEKIVEDEATDLMAMFAASIAAAEAKSAAA